MTPRARRLTAALGALVLLLFAGRWAAGLLTDRWWAAELAPAAVDFLTQWHVLRLTLDLAGIFIATAWFVGHLLVVHRAVGSVQIRRQVANLEIREALTPGTLLATAIGTGVLLGLLVGGGAGARWEEVALAWHGVRYAVADPLLGSDLGTYVAQLPLWRSAHAFFLLLMLLGLGVALALYLVVGAIRWGDGRPAISDHARAHLGWLLAGLALALAWGYLLEPYELVAGLGAPVSLGEWRVVVFVAPLLAGVALATTGLSAAWATRPRHSLALAGWMVLSAASLLGHWLLPAMAREDGAPLIGPATVERFDRMAFGLHPLTQDRLHGDAAPEPAAVPPLWTASILDRLPGRDSGGFQWIDPAPVPLPGGPRAGWLLVRAAPGGRTVVSAVAAGVTGPAGEPLFLQRGDSVPRATNAPFLELPGEILRPDAPRYRFGGATGRGARIGGWPRRIALAWALQTTAVLGELPAEARIDWWLSPSARLSRLAPFADWGTPVARAIGDDLLWLVDGYLASASFPLSGRARWEGREVGSVRAAFLGTVNAVTGATRIYLRPGADRLASTWAGIAEGVVEPAGAIPDPVLDAAPYPVELFQVQAQVLEHRRWQAGMLGGRPAGAASSDEPPRPETIWTTSGPAMALTYEVPGERQISAVVAGTREGGGEVLRLVRLDPAATLPNRAVLQARWENFTTFQALSDSIQAEGSPLEAGPVRYDLTPTGLVAYQPYYASRPGAPVATVWVNVAAGNRLGAGRSVREAWSNLLGTTVPTPAGAAQGSRLEEARRWLLRADSALRAGEWAAFGRAWTQLRRALGAPADSAR